MADKKYKNPKVVGTQYALKVNEEIVVIRNSKKELKHYLKEMPIDDSIKSIELVRQNITEYHIAKYVPENKKVLVSHELGLDFDE